MNILDIILAVLLFWGGVMGFRRGFFREAAAFFGLVIGIYLAIIASDVTGRVVAGLADWNPLPFKVVAFFVTLFLVITALWAVGASLTKLFKVIMLNFVNRLAGIFFGVVKTAVLISVAFFFLRLLNEHVSLFSDSWFSESYLYNRLEGLAPWLFKGLMFF
jgi:membrane protein required for colicin V production